MSTYGKLMKLAAFALVLGFAEPVLAQTIIDEWSNIKAPPAPLLKAVKVDPKTTALLMLDFVKQSCNEKVRPRCVATLPAAKKLLTEARANNVLVVYSIGARVGEQWSIGDTLPDVAPTGKEPYVQAGPDKFLNTDLEKILKDHGIKTVIVKDKAEAEAAFNERTALVYILAGRGDDGPLGTQALCAMARPKNVPVFVDAAAEVLTIPNVHLGRGASVVGYSGGKCLRGPQCAGLALGEKNLLQSAWANSAPHHAFGRSLKVGKEEIMGMLAAVEAWTKRDHKAEWAQWEEWLNHISKRVMQVEGVTTEVKQPDEGLSNRSPRLVIHWDGAKLGITGTEVSKLVLDSEPRIVLDSPRGRRPRQMESQISITPYMMMPGDEKVVADRLNEVLGRPPKMEAPPVPAGEPANVAGQWEAQLTFLRGSAQHIIILEQKGTDLAGTHRGEMISGDLRGAVAANEVHFRSSIRCEGTRLSYDFTGKADGDTMEGRVGLGEYGDARWTAKRHKYA